LQTNIPNLENNIDYPWLSFATKTGLASLKKLSDPIRIAVVPGLSMMNSALPIPAVFDSFPWQHPW